MQCDIAIDVSVCVFVGRLQIFILIQLSSFSLKVACMEIGKSKDMYSLDCFFIEETTEIEITLKKISLLLESVEC